MLLVNIIITPYTEAVRKKKGLYRYIFVLQKINTGSNITGVLRVKVCSLTSHKMSLLTLGSLRGTVKPSPVSWSFKDTHDLAHDSPSW